MKKLLLSLVLCMGYVSAEDTAPANLEHCAIENQSCDKVDPSNQDIVVLETDSQLLIRMPRVLVKKALEEGNDESDYMYLTLQKSSVAAVDNNDDDDEGLPEGSEEDQDNSN